MAILARDRPDELGWAMALDAMMVCALLDLPLTDAIVRAAEATWRISIEDGAPRLHGG